jgi:hypothetical protein
MLEDICRKHTLGSLYLTFNFEVDDAIFLRFWANLLDLLEKDA